MDSPFIQYVKKVFDSWTALRIAAQQSTAGRNTKDLIQALVPYITQNLRKDTDPFDVAGWLEDYLSEKLNVELDDGSQDSVAKLITDAYALHQKGQNSAILEMLSAIPSGCDLSQCQPQEVLCEVDGSGDSESEDGSEGEDDSGDMDTDDF